MIEEPERYVQVFRKAGADWISVHAEATHHLQRTLAQIRESGARPAVALNPATPLFHLDHVWEEVEMVLVMTVNPGFGGQIFIPEMMNKVRNLRKKAERLRPNLRIEVDGGVGPKNVKPLAEAGATVFVAGSAIFRSQNYKEAVSTMRAALGTK